MSEPSRVGRQLAPTTPRRHVVAWALWDCGATATNAIVVTFVFSVYLTNTVGARLPGDTSPASWLGRALTLAGLAVALLAPVTGILVGASHRRRWALIALTFLSILLTSTMSLIRDDYHYLLPGLLLLACTAACLDLATVPYNAMLAQLSSSQNAGKVSGIGLAIGYLGAVGLLLVVYIGFISGTGEDRGLLGISADDGQNVRAAMLLTSAWFATFAVPVLFRGHNVAAFEGPTKTVGFVDIYRKLWTEVIGEWRRDHNIIYYLVASAVFRDGLTGVFAFAGVLGVNVYGISDADVLLFGVSGGVIAAFGAVLGGILDDRLGSKPIIVGSLSAMVAVGLTLLSMSASLAFWICGLLLCLLTGPTLSCARTLMLRMSASGKESVAFGLYTTTGRAASFLAPSMFFTFVDLAGSDRAGMAGLCTVIATGLIGMLAVRPA